MGLTQGASQGLLTPTGLVSFGNLAIVLDRIKTAE
jgi:hypothetical protein